MGSDTERPETEAPSPEPSTPAEPEVPAPPRRTRGRIASLAFLVFGALVAVYLGTQGPQEQHVRIVLGARAPDVTAVELRYVSEDGEVVRTAHLTFAPGQAPRIVSHEPKLANGDYRLEIDVDLAPEPGPSARAEEGERPAFPDGGPAADGDGARAARDGRRAVQRQVTLGGGSTQVDISSALTRADPHHEAR